MLATAIALAEARGFRWLDVSTFDRHAAACRLYRAAGFVETGRRPREAFGHVMEQRDFRRALRG